MLYLTYQLHADVMVPVRTWASIAANAGGPPLMADHRAMRNLTAVYELIARSGLTHTRPAFGIEAVTVGNRVVEVREEAAASTPFGTLLHFKKDIAAAQPRVLMVAPLSGHFSTLLRATVQTMLPEHDVYITDWHNARDVPLTAGCFGFDEYIEHLIKFLDLMGPGTHVLAVCQPCVAVLAAVAVMAQDGSKAQPRSMTLMAGPIDTRVNPTTVNELANKHPIDWFERTLTASVPLRYPGAFRRVYPGFVQLAAFMSMNVERHVKAHCELYENIANGELEKARWAEEELRQYHRIPKQAFRLELDVPSEKLRVDKHIPEANKLFIRAMEFKGKGSGVDFIDNQRRAELLFQEILTKYPHSDKISDVAFMLGDIYESKPYKMYYRAVEYYHRCYQWNSKTSHEARLRAARIYDKHLNNRTKALEMYREVAQYDVVDPRRKQEADRRIAELAATK